VVGYLHSYSIANTSPGDSPGIQNTNQIRIQIRNKLKEKNQNTKYHCSFKIRTFVEDSIAHCGQGTIGRRSSLLGMAVLDNINCVMLVASR
jgi:hypothetical protein